MLLKKKNKILLFLSKISYLETHLSLTEQSDYLVVAYSGGKDSTLLLHFVLEYVTKACKPVIIISSDTLVENPVIAGHIHTTLNSIDRFLCSQKIPYQVKIVNPESHETFWVNVIGKGYSLPHRRFRWCQRVLKIRPVERYLKTLNGNGVLLLGHRLDESSTRKRTILSNGYYGKMRVLMPLLYFTEEDVWNFLMTEEPVWGGSFTDVIELYKHARGECPLIGKPLSGGCGSRFGCWVCTMVKDDRSMANMIKSRKFSYLLPYYEFRNWLIGFCSKPENRYPYTRSGKPANNAMGCLTHEARQRILEEVFRLEKVTGNKIISQYEICLINEYWRDEQCKKSL